VARLFHGTSVEIAERIITTGFGSLSTLEDGWFGKAIYLTDKPCHAVRHFKSFDRPCLMIVDTIIFNPYPVIHTDAPWDTDPKHFRFYGKEPTLNFKSHIIPVRLSLETSDYRPPLNGEEHTAIEFAIFHEKYLIPRIFVYYQEISKPVRRHSLSHEKSNKDWNVEDVVNWMKALNLQHDYTQLIVSNGVDGEVLCTMSETDWKEIGMVSFGDRRKCVNALSEWKNKN